MPTVTQARPSKKAFRRKPHRTGMAVVRDAAVPPMRPFAPDERADCACGGLMTLQTGLTSRGRNAAGLVVIANLSGLVCGSCGARSWDPPTFATIQAALMSRPAGFGVRAKVSRLSRDNVGAYLPKDVQNHMGIHAGDALVLQPIDHRLLLVEVEHPADELDGTRRETSPPRRRERPGPRQTNIAHKL